MNHESVIEAVSRATACGLCVVPPREDGTKAPDVSGWTKYQNLRPDKETIDAWYKGHRQRTGLGFVCGTVSGNLEVLDFDDCDTYHAFKQACIDNGLAEVVEFIESGYLEYSPNGVHWLYRCDEISGNQKLATNKDRKALIETRGEGGYIVAAPSHGKVNSRGAYTRERGSLSTIATITPEERRELHALARSFSEIAPQTWTPQTGTTQGDRPGDEYNTRASWDDILGQHGWAKVRTYRELTYWRRPGKGQGVSATTNIGGSDLLYMFTSSTVFEPNKAYSKFSAYAILNHGGDFSAAARDLRDQGFGQNAGFDGEAVDLSAFMVSGPQADPQSFPRHLLDVPGLLGQLAAHINATSIKPQPILALGASIAAVATIIGRKVKAETGLRPNVYVLGVADTGSGKERAREAIRELFTAAGVDSMVGFDDMASDAGIVSAVSEAPSCLFLLDEVGRMLAQLSSKRAPPHLANQVSTYLRLYSASNGVYYGKGYANRQQQLSINQPNLCIYGTTVPGSLYASMTSEQVSDGFLSRFMIFESEDPDPMIVDALPRQIPESLVDGFKAWASVRGGNLTDINPAPKTVPTTDNARSTWRDLESDMRAKRAELRVSGDGAGLFTRVWALAIKLSLIRACGVCIGDPEITEGDAVWGSELARYLTLSMHTKIARHVSDNEKQALFKRVLDVVRKGNGISRSELIRRTQWLDKRERESILSDLIESGQVAKEELKTTTKPVTRYWAPK